jgi:ubiquinone/menaquinone biosynthesis C-methylase UbiE
MDIFFEIHKNLPREGPGDPESTLKALSFVPAIPAEGKILDIACGPGMQTMDLARNTGAEIEALDTHQPFIEVLEKKIQQGGLSHRVQTRNHSMFDLDYREESFDLIWSEGAIYIMGFEKGLKTWKKYLKPGGHLVVSEVSWLKKEISNKPRAFWGTHYPEIGTISKNIKIIEHRGYIPVAHFILPEESWWKYYYTPMVKRIQELRAEHPGDAEWEKALEEELEEVDLYKNYSSEYGYVFYIMKKI